MHSPSFQLPLVGVIGLLITACGATTSEPTPGATPASTTDAPIAADAIANDTSTDAGRSDTGSDAQTACTSALGASACASCCAKTHPKGCDDFMLLAYSCSATCQSFGAINDLCRGSAQPDSFVTCLDKSIEGPCTTDDTYEHCAAPNDCPGFSGCIAACAH